MFGDNLNTCYRNSSSPVRTEGTKKTCSLESTEFRQWEELQVKRKIEICVCVCIYKERDRGQERGRVET